MWLWSPDGCGAGVWVAGAVPEYERVAMITEHVQEWVFEELWSAGAPTNWPPCPRHPNNHPMTVSIRDSVAVWTCPADDAVVGGL